MDIDQIKSKFYFFTVRLSELRLLMPPELMIKVDKLLKPDVCNESRLLLLLVLLLLILFVLFCVIISFNLLRPNTKKNKIILNMKKNSNDVSLNVILLL